MRLSLPLVAVALAAGFVLGRETAGSASAEPSGHVFRIQSGDVVRVPSTATRCVASQEVGIANFFCTRTPRGRHQVVFYKDRVFVWRVGQPDRPAFVARWKP